MFNLKKQLNVYNTLLQKKSFEGTIKLNEKEFNGLTEAFEKKEIIAIHDFYEASPLYAKIDLADFGMTVDTKDGVWHFDAYVELKLC